MAKPLKLQSIPVKIKKMRPFWSENAKKLYEILGHFSNVMIAQSA